MQNLEASDKKGTNMLESLAFDMVLKNYNAKLATFQKQQKVCQS